MAERFHDLSWERFLEITEQFPQLRRVVLHGIGEPLLNRELGRMIRHLKGRGAHVLFNSNGLLLHGGKARSQQAVRPWQLAVWRMVPFARSIARVGGGSASMRADTSE